MTTTNETTINAIASNVTSGSTGAGGWDVDIALTLGGRTVEGEVTLLRDEHSGRPSSWGQRDHWISSPLLHLIDAVCSDEDGVANVGEQRKVYEAIEAAAEAAIKASGVDEGVAEPDPAIDGSDEIVRA